MDRRSFLKGLAAAAGLAVAGEGAGASEEAAKAQGHQETLQGLEAPGVNAELLGPAKLAEEFVDTLAEELQAHGTKPGFDRAFLDEQHKAVVDYGIAYGNLMYPIQLYKEMEKPRPPDAVILSQAIDEALKAVPLLPEGKLRDDVYSFLYKEQEGVQGTPPPKVPFGGKLPGLIT